MDAFEFADYEHLDAFTYHNQVGRKIRVMHPMGLDGDRFSDEIQIGQLPLAEGAVMDYVFDFGDWWEFKVQLETIEPPMPPQPVIQISASRKPQLSPVPELGPDSGTAESEEFSGEVLEAHGEAPPQYPDDDGW